VKQIVQAQSGVTVAAEGAACWWGLLVLQLSRLLVWLVLESLSDLFQSGQDLVWDAFTHLIDNVCENKSDKIILQLHSN
jgi:hypothetical protein